MAVNEKTVQQRKYDKKLFQSKRDILLRNWGACVDTRFWHVSKKSVAKKKRFCVVRSVDLERWSCATVEDLADRGRRD